MALPRGNKKIFLWALLWALTRLLIVARVGLWNDVQGVGFQDIYSYENWAHILSVGHQPAETSWQYPPGAAFLFLLPTIGGGSYGISFIVTMLAFDLIGLWLVWLLGRRTGRDWGVWVWLAAMPFLSLLSVTRFDLVPTVIAIAALLVIRVRPVWFGALAGLGASVKVWPIFVLFGEWDRRRLLRALGAAVVVLALVFLAGQLIFGDQASFLDHQGGRGLEVESVAATPWHVREELFGTPSPIANRYGAIEVDSDLADAVGKALDGIALLVLIGAGAWWWCRDRAIRAGRIHLADVALARDFVFAIVLAFMVTSRVLSPQYMIWMIGLCAVVLSSARTRLLRPALLVLGAILMGSAIGELMLILRNAVLLVAAVDAACILIGALRGEVDDEAPLAAAWWSTSDTPQYEKIP